MKLLPFQRQLFDCCYAVVDEFHHLEEAAENSEAEVIGNENKCHGADLFVEAFEHHFESGAA